MPDALRPPRGLTGTAGAVGPERAGALPPHAPRPAAPDLRIVPLAPPVADAAVALWHAAGLTRPWNDPHADFARALAAPAAAVLGGVLPDGTPDGALVATVMVGDDGHRGWVYYLAVAAAHRGRGYGTAMLRAAEGWLAARGAPKVQLMVRASNAGVVRFYEALGYESSDVVVLQRALAAPPDPATPG